MKVAEDKLTDLLSIAKKAAISAGAYLSGYRSSGKEIKKEFGRNIQISADIEAEKIILGHLQDNSNFSILSEEKGRGAQKTDGDE